MPSKSICLTKVTRILPEFQQILNTQNKNLTEFRKLFGVVKQPPYCQIAMPKGVIQDWGLVEFFDPNDSEETQRETNLTLFHDRRIRVHFCIPGVNAINIYMQVSQNIGF